MNVERGFTKTQTERLLMMFNGHPDSLELMRIIEAWGPIALEYLLEDAGATIGPHGYLLTRCPEAAESLPPETAWERKRMAEEQWKAAQHRRLVSL